MTQMRVIRAPQESYLTGELAIKTIVPLPAGFIGDMDWDLAMVEHASHAMEWTGQIWLIPEPRIYEVKTVYVGEPVKP